MADLNMEPLKIVGYEGLFGTLAMVRPFAPGRLLRMPSLSVSLFLFFSVAIFCCRSVGSESGVRQPALKTVQYNCGA